ncbi:MAG TPA: cupin domain-containing protein [Candidatus Omnitrophota bacterium]|nr:cupin domain-containing protein [Candidatus Omnitrophota bacterium]HPB67344.1 cupin domain-containing protein [Candidatus Omnitrophota bacterium]HQO57395.1 cupin domain-containing protein [Candidatus Omnitrophota bacterium]
MKHTIQNILSGLPESSREEIFTSLLKTGHFDLERIISTGQITPPGEWLSQARHEWVLVLSGRARLRFQEAENIHDLEPGDAVFIPAGCFHRVEWTDPGQKTVWLALHYA